MTNFPVDKLDEELESASDFAFEMRVLHGLAGLQPQLLEHGGTYLDCVTGKPRQFDVRAVLTVGNMTNCRAALAVECKNLGENTALLVHCVPRVESESYHCLFYAEGGIPDVSFVERSGPYATGGLVGKAIDQAVLKAGSVGLHGDGKIYARYAQAISSSRYFAEQFAGLRIKGGALTALLPILVVPNGKLLCQSYAPNGKRNGKPSHRTSIDYYVDAEHVTPQGGGRLGALRYRVSHVRIVEEGALVPMLRNVMDRVNENDFFVSKEATLYGDFR